MVAVGGSTGAGAMSSGGHEPAIAAGGTPATTSGGATATGGRDALGGAAPEGGELHPGEPPSCVGFDGTECQGGDCCASLLVPGGVVEVDGTTQTLPSFYLDRFEVTVARFRQYMNAVGEWTAAGNPADGAGAHPLVPESGWRSDWLEVTGDEEEEEVAHLELYELFTDLEAAPSVVPEPATYPLPGADHLPLNRATIHAAFAFCIWDGGRLPAAAEWLYAAHGGDAYTSLPWGESPPADVVFADLPAAVPEPFPNPINWNYVGIPVGALPAAAGRFGHQDLIGGLTEFVRDTGAGSLEDEELIELAEDEIVESIVVFSERAQRKAVGLDWSYTQNPAFLVESWDWVRPANDRPSGTTGFRCARDP
jgi:sulfatase modifying factor 1